jgi:hypothetical protein
MPWLYHTKFIDVMHSLYIGCCTTDRIFPQLYDDDSFSNKDGEDSSDEDLPRRQATKMPSLWDKVDYATQSYPPELDVLLVRDNGKHSDYLQNSKDLLLVSVHKC